MNERLTIELEPQVMRWLEGQAAELSAELCKGDSTLPVDAVTAAGMVAAFANHQYSEWTGETSTIEEDL